MDRDEQRLLQLFKLLADASFVAEENSVTGEVHELYTVIEDREGTVVINGEWDRDDLKEILFTIWSEGYAQALNDLEKEKSTTLDMPFVADRLMKRLNARKP